jgi:outer membrane protein
MSRWVAGFAAVIATCLAASAAAGETEPAPVSLSDWTVTIGVESRVMPVYEGSSNSMYQPFPLFDIRHSDTPSTFRSSRDGASIGILETDQFRFGPTLKFRLPRREDSDPSLRGLGNINWAVEAGGFAEYWPAKWLRTRAELRQGFDGHHGLVSDLSADWVMPVTKQMTLSGGPRMTLSSSEAMSPYFSITEAQSLASGLPVFDAKGGLRSYGAGVQARYEISKVWATYSFIEYSRLAGDAADSPLITQRGTRDQIEVGLGISYSFDLHGM